MIWSTLLRSSSRWLNGFLIMQSIKIAIFHNIYSDVEFGTNSRKNIFSTIQKTGVNIVYHCKIMHLFKLQHLILYIYSRENSNYVSVLGTLFWYAARTTSYIFNLHITRPLWGKYRVRAVFAQNSLLWKRQQHWIKRDASRISWETPS
jgi:hypothetical protein